MPVYLSGKTMNPVARVLTAIGGALLAVGAFFVGLAALAVVLGLAVIGWIVASLWLWWARRKVASQPTERVSRRAEARHQALDADYTVVSRRRD